MLLRNVLELFIWKRRYILYIFVKFVTIAKKPSLSARCFPAVLCSQEVRTYGSILYYKIINYNNSDCKMFQIAVCRWACLCTFLSIAREKYQKRRHQRARALWKPVSVCMHLFDRGYTWLRSKYSLRRHLRRRTFRSEAELNPKQMRGPRCRLLLSCAATQGRQPSNAVPAG